MKPTEFMLKESTIPSWLKPKTLSTPPYFEQTNPFGLNKENSEEHYLLWGGYKTYTLQ